MVALKLVPNRLLTTLEKYVGVVLKRGSTGEAVKALQRAIGKLTVDGSYGPLTEARVKEYQKSKGLAVTGVTDAAVWKALMAQTTTTSGSVVTSLTTEFTAYKGTVLKLGSTGAAVKVLQRGLGGLTVDGSFGPMTQSAVKAFQSKKGLTVTGVVDARTWTAVELKVHPLLPYWGTVLKPGSTGAAVVALQKALRITADGSFGPLTQAAVKAVQSDAKLTQTGVVGTLTWKAVEARMPR
jgi:peptidoglycan hydrolase-like protein with peptidoglycan-binding domain